MNVVNPRNNLVDNCCDLLFGELLVVFLHSFHDFQKVTIFEQFKSNINIVIIFTEIKHSA